MNVILKQKEELLRKKRVFHKYIRGVCVCVCVCRKSAILSLLEILKLLKLK